MVCLPFILVLKIYKMFFHFALVSCTMDDKVQIFSALFVITALCKSNLYFQGGYNYVLDREEANEQ